MYLINRYNKLNGPINAVRIKGNINSVNKVLYIFMDYHEDIELQTTCEPLHESTEFMVYLRDNFEIVNKIVPFNKKHYDFFIEMDPMLKQSKTQNNEKEHTVEYKGRYTDEIEKFVKEIFSINGKKSNKYTNIKLHLIDIRSAIMLNSFEIIQDVLTIGQKLWNTLHLDKNDLAIIETKLNHLLIIMNELYNGLYGSELIGNKISYDIQEKIKILIKKSSKKDNLFEYIKQYICAKLINQSEYSHKNIYEIIINILNNEVKNSFVELFKIIEKTIIKINEIKDIILEHQYKFTVDYLSEVVYEIPLDIKRSIIYKLMILLNEIDHYVLMKIANKIMDLYLIKQFLSKKSNKDDVTNGISFIGVDHCVNILFVLVKYFNFEITHISTINNSTIEKISKEIKTRDKFDGLQHYFYPKKYRQCIDVTKFPKHFQ
jgi:hypothetical protein